MDGVIDFLMLISYFFPQLICLRWDFDARVLTGTNLLSYLSSELANGNFDVGIGAIAVKSPRIHP